MSDEEPNSVENAAPEEEEKAVVSPRKRGRPRTRPYIEKPEVDPNKPKRPRGRPKGSFKPKKPENTEPKRPRGRPPKSKNVQEDSTGTTSPETPKEPISPVKESNPGGKKGRGRPKGSSKKEPAKPQAIASPEKKGRGRPRKS